VVLRPTLMFGWFDRKHLGWLSRFMQKVPVFPIPGHGRYLRQPLYVGDFCRVIISSIEHRTQGVYNISGLEEVDYIDIIREIKKATKAGCWIVKIPYGLFHGLLHLGAVRQEAALHHPAARRAGGPDVFEVIDWPGIFQVKATPLPRPSTKPTTTPNTARSCWSSDPWPNNASPCSAPARWGWRWPTSWPATAISRSSSKPTTGWAA
jgi:hypothetical protein